ncbi:hypothetical protein MHPYR_370003 [uncultured Mycobacterium sp.]|uniref:Uncharacterized protein n=1 Tax=uncultured Mycobacterium sp. TaxID=171292 RepID=A0A1Y5PDQ3_9MYCO|nr:hypothetical protein MHPYR_370003 [uncultured Mycobacterium sp.]
MNCANIKIVIFVTILGSCDGNFASEPNRS